MYKKDVNVLNWVRNITSNKYCFAKMALVSRWLLSQTISFKIILASLSVDLLQMIFIDVSFKYGASIKADKQYLQS